MQFFIYLARRTVISAVLVFLISVVVFLITHVVLGDPVELVLGGQSSFATPEQIEALRHTLGLDQSLLHQYGTWVHGLLDGDLGRSYRLPVSVQTMLGKTLPVTLELTFLGMLAAIVGGVALGMLGAMRPGGAVDLLASLASIAGQAMPFCWLGLVLVYLGAVVLGLFPASGYVSPFDDPVGNLRFMALPVLTIAIPYAGVIARYVRGRMAEELASKHVTAARAKGLHPLYVGMAHGLRNILPSLVTVIGLDTAVLLGGAIITEQVYALPGMGSLLVSSVLGRDFPVLQAVVLYIAVVVVLVNLVVDLLVGVFDPRMRSAAT